MQLRPPGASSNYWNGVQNLYLSYTICMRMNSVGPNQTHFLHNKDEISGLYQIPSVHNLYTDEVDRPF